MIYLIVLVSSGAAVLTALYVILSLLPISTYMKSGLRRCLSQQLQRLQWIGSMPASAMVESSKFHAGIFLLSTHTGKSVKSVVSSSRPM